MRKYFLRPLFAFLAIISFGSLSADEEIMQNEIKHLVILMLENRSFDNVLGWLYEQESPKNFIPTDKKIAFMGLSEDSLKQYTNYVRNSKGEVIFSSPPIKGLPSVIGSKLINSPKFDPHEPFENVHNQIFNGETTPSMLGFLQDFSSLWDEDDWLDQKDQICAVMETYTDKELPLMYGLAKHYAVSDFYFCSVPTQTNPNRAFSICGTADGQINNGFLGKSVFTSDTVWNRLYEESPETTWAVFWQSDLIPMIYPGPLSGVNQFPAIRRIPNYAQHIKRFDEFHELARKGELPDISYLEPEWTLSENISPKEKMILNHLFRNQDFIVGFQGSDCHPPGDVRTAENLIANIYTSLIANEKAWNHTLFVIVFDEHGGLFDHLPPPSAMPPDNQNQSGFNFDRYGVRVPAIFISPLIAQGTLLRPKGEIPFDHTSLISTILKWKKVDREKWKLGNRVAIAPTFDSVVTLKTPRKDAVIPQNGHNLVEKNSNSTVIHMGDKFYIKDPDENYLVKPIPLFKNSAVVGPYDQRIPYTFAGGIGKLTVGSFALLQCCEPSLNNRNNLQTSLTCIDCVFKARTQMPNQWWTIKCMDDFCTGSEINYGDRIYIENHTYLNLFQYVPCRLSKVDEVVKAIPITEDGVENECWILEKVP